MHLAISAEPLQDGRSGFGRFLLSAIRELHAVRPEWRITVVANSGFEELRTLADDRLRIIAWDTQPLLKLTVSLLTKVTRTTLEFRRDAAIRLWSFAPLAVLRRSGGHLPSLWAALVPDVVWAPFHSVGDSRRAPYFHLQDLGCPVLTSIHDVDPLLFPDEWSALDVDGFRDNLRALARCSNVVVAETAILRDAVTKVGDLAADSIVVVSSPPLLSDKTPSPPSPDQAAEILQSLGIQGRYIFYPSSHTRIHKNHARLLLAWKRLHDQLGDQCPMLVGTNMEPYGAALRGTIDALELQTLVRFTGSVDSQTLALLYQGCQAVIAPTLSESAGSGLVTEALLLGRPALCSDFSSAREYMDSYGIEGVHWFSPYSVEEIAEAVVRQLHDAAQVDVAQQQRRLLAQQPILWRNWATSYAELLERAALSRRPS